MCGQAVRVPFSLTGVEKGEACCGESEITGDGDEVARPGPVPADGGSAAQVAERGDGDGEGVGADDVPSHDRGSGSGALVAQPDAELVGPGGGEVGGGCEADEERGGVGPHGGDVGEVLRGGFVADVARTGPVPAEVPSLHEQVGGGNDAAVSGPDDGCVVAGAEQNVLGGGETGGDPSNQPEFTEISDSA